MNILVLNCGSSTVKFQIIETDQDLIASDADRKLALGVVERIGSQAVITLQAEGRPKQRSAEPVRDHRAAIDHILRWMVSPDSLIDTVGTVGDIQAVGHRVVHGGERFQRSVRIDDEVLAGIEECIDLAPLHNPANLKGIRVAGELLGPEVPQVAVFDTAFHSTMPESSFLYAIPYQYYRRYKIRRYGFHGTSHRYIAYRYRRLHDLEPEQVNIITLHLGNGASACAIKAGRSFITSMGFTPLEGLVMGTRSGDIDPSLIEFLMHKEGIDVSEVDTMLNKRSGLLGLSGLTSDMRDLLEEEAEHQDRRARLAIDVFCRRIRRYIGGYLADMGGASAVVFTGGIGENAPQVRERICDDLEHLGLILDRDRNAALESGTAGEISAEEASLKAWVIPTDEELLIARDTYRVVEDIPRRW
jgi:acetate kinase